MAGQLQPSARREVLIAPEFAELARVLDGVAWEAEAAPPRAGELTFVGERAGAMLGHEPDEWLASPTFFAEHVHPADRERVLAHRAMLLAGEHGARPQDVEYRFLAKDGRIAWLRERAWIVHDANGAPARLRGFLVDITRTRNAETRLALQQETTGILALADSFEEAAVALLRNVAERLGWQVALWWRVEGDKLRCAARWIDPRVGEPPLVANLGEMAFAPGEGLPGLAWQRARGEWTRDLAQRGDLPRAQLARDSGLHGAAAVPIRSPAGVHGVLEFFSAERLAEDPVTASVLESVGAQAGLYIARREAEARLRRSDALKGAVLSAALDCIVSMDAEGRVVEWNDASVRTFGYAQDEAVGRPLAELIVPPELREAHRRGLARHVATGEKRVLGQRIELPAVRRDGTRFPVEIAILRVPFPGPPLFTAFVRDITDRKRDEEALRASQAQLAEFHDGIPIALFATTPDGRFLRANPAFASLLGYPDAASVVAAPVPTLYADAKKREEVMEILRREGRVQGFEAEFVRVDGSRVWVSISARIIRDAEGNELRFEGALEDVTERKRAEGSLSWQRSVLEAIAKGAPLRDVLEVLCRDAEAQAPGHRFSVLLVDDDGKRLRHGAAPSLPAHYSQAIDGIEIAEGVGSCGTAAHRGQTVLVNDIENDPLWKDFKALALPLGLRACWSTPIFASDGKVLGTWAVYREVVGPPTPNDAAMVLTATRLASVAIERARAERQLVDRAEQLAALAAQLERSNRELDQFAYVASHDLKAPLRGIANLSRWIEEDLGSVVQGDSKANLELLRGRVNRMEGLIDGILEYSRAGRVKNKSERVDVNALLREAVDLVAPPEGFRVVIAPDMPTLRTDRVRLQQVFMNLVTNAIKHHHHKESGTVRIGVEDAGAMWRFSVADDGPGISPRFHDKIFVIFQTLQARDKLESTGVGLALVKKIVEGQGGSVTVESDEGEGATFRFTWPKSANEAIV